jgi:hypothetical protein
MAAYSESFSDTEDGWATQRILKGFNIHHAGFTDEKIQSKI